MPTFSSKIVDIRSEEEHGVVSSMRSLSIIDLNIQIWFIFGEVFLCKYFDRTAKIIRSSFEFVFSETFFFLGRLFKEISPKSMKGLHLERQFLQWLTYQFIFDQQLSWVPLCAILAGGVFILFSIYNKYFRLLNESSLYRSSFFPLHPKLCLPPDKLLFYFVRQQTHFPIKYKLNTYIEIHHSCWTCVYFYLSQSTIWHLLRFGCHDVVILQVQTFGMCSCLNDRGNCCALANVNTVNFIGFTYTNTVSSAERQ